ncbi:uncharacterized protein [Mytilus edulis]|uniref:uncharacterized protein n=1 Tax=Mytilus edulis TaxID=6550 RepID=UPI0039F1135C
MVKDINRDMWKKSRKIGIFLDNATSHSHNLKLSNVELKFFPANTTSKLHPLDLGIIRAFKARYRKHMIKHLLPQIDNCNTVTELCKEINVLKAIHWIKKSWNETKSTTIESCFRDAGFPVKAPTNVDEPEDPDDDIPLADLVEQLGSRDPSIQITEADDVDDNLATESAFDSEREPDLIREFTRYTLIESDEDVDTDIPTEVQPGSDMNHTEILDLLTKLRKFSTSKDSRYLDQTEQMISMTEDLIVKSKLATRQTTLDNYFSLQ